MKKKIKILGVKKSKLINEYVIKKEKGVLEGIKLLLEKIGYDKEEFGDLYYLFYDEEAEKNPKASSVLDITKSKDERFNIKNQESDVDIFIGDKKIFLVIRTKKDMQNKISKEIFKIGSFKK